MTYRLWLTGTLLMASTAQAQVTPTLTGPPGQIASTPELETGNDWSGFLSGGAGAAPEYAGSRTYRIIPFAVGEVRYKDVSAEVRGLQLHVNPFGDSALYAGPAMSLDLGRRQSSGGIARNLPDIKTAINAGAFVGYRFGGGEQEQKRITTELSVLHDVSGVSKGLLANALVSYVAVSNGRWNVIVDVSANFGDARYQRTYFGVDLVDAFQSGLAAYRPKAGLRDAGGGITAVYQLGGRWGLIGRAGYSRLVDEAGKSPIAKAGSRNQLLGGLALSYRF